MSPVRPLLLRRLFLLEAGDLFAYWEPIDCLERVGLEILEVSDWEGTFLFGMAFPVLKVIDMLKKQ